MDQVQFLVNPARLQLDQLGQEAVREEVQTSSIKHRAGQIEVMDPGLTDPIHTNHQAGQIEVMDPRLTDPIHTNHRAGQIEVMDPGLTDRRLTNHQAGQPEMMDPGLTDHKSKVSTDLKKGLSHINLC